MGDLWDICISKHFGIFVMIISSDSGKHRGRNERVDVGEILHDLNINHSDRHRKKPIK
jgi:hypothetical protein